MVQCLVNYITYLHLSIDILLAAGLQELYRPSGGSGLIVPVCGVDFENNVLH